MDGDGLAVGDEEAERVGEIELALRVLRLQSLEHGPQLRRREHVDRGVDLAQVELVRRRVGSFDDARQPSRSVAHEPAVRTRIRRLEGEHRRGGALAAMRGHKLTQDVRREQRRVAREHEDVPVGRSELRSRRADRIAGAERRLLDRDVETIEGVRRRGRRDDDDRLRARLLRRRQHPVDDPPAEQRMQVLRRGRPHAGPEPGGHHDGCDVRTVHERQDGWGARIRTWDRGTKTRCLTTWLRPRDRRQV